MLLVAAGALAGVLGTAGGIASLISYPALLIVGVAPLPANVTNSIAVLTCEPAAVLRSRPELRGGGALLRRLALPCVLGGSGGAVLLLATPPGVFDWIVPFLVAVASMLMLSAPRVGRWHRRRARPAGEPVVVAAVAAVAVYSGYFGAGAGIMVLVILLVLVEEHLARANAIKNLVLLLSDAVPAIIFALDGPVVWSAVWPLALGSLAGGALGPAIARPARPEHLRPAIALCGVALSTWLLVSAAR